MQIKNKKIQWIARTAIMIALLLILQVSTASLGQYVTGSCVNFTLAMSVFVGGFASGISVALLSPIFAFLLGIGPAFIMITPCISAGNLAFVLLLALLWRKLVNKSEKVVFPLISVLAGAIAKFLVLYLLVVKLVIPSLGLPDGKVAAMSAMFSFPQLITAIIGGFIATILAMRLVKSNLKQYFESSK